MFKRMIIMLCVIGAVFAALAWFVNFRAGMIKQAMASLADPPQTVSTTTAQSSDWQSTLTAIGTFRAVNGADLSLQQPGIVDSIHFESGKEVAAGDVLLDLRKEDDVAKLQSLQATADGYGITLRRDQGQLKINAVSQATVDSDAVNERNALALVAQQRALVDQKTLRAPFAGRLGVRQVDVGQYLTAGTTIVTLQALDRLFVDFTLPQQAIDQVTVGQQVLARVDAFPDRSFKGTVQAFNSKVDQTSRNVQVRALFDNADRKLLPGMFARIDLRVGRPTSYLTLPQTAIVYNTYGESVFLAVKSDAPGKEGLVARQTFIKTGATRGDQVAVVSGLDQNATVVTAGQIKLRNGTLLKVDNSVTLPNDPNPSPVDQ
ncbi:efflux RND transporter periplasmic adaptor subunit [Bradyrhizobium sp. SSUT18]|uniref:efflux RND transporter periplasmic adaptor subunit n=1 Tax=Bradyrhizobium sp. SSUT18 TaxID=3040602 RepID=UPI00244A1702|nr:efflux RND transporter periplasmic adaptor subunit [Bradyrhizobium sp. SSUT18]MDH2404982.1 efflux RND transporter periplasmic adaptor subunit [Bradyrhizobium sp. SSUT18]